MAEIKSTLEKAMERVARMEKASPEDFAGEEKTKEGMKIGAAFLNGGLADIDQALAGHQERDLVYLRRGLVRVFLRNIILPRHEDNKEAVDKCLQGLLAINGQAGDLAAVFNDMKQILDQYLQHKKQLRGQLEAALMQQLEQAAKQAGVPVKVDPTRHPRFQEEWLRISGDLNEEYGRALEQHKALISERLG